jgi:hypothetical protein
MDVGLQCVGTATSRTSVTVCIAVTVDRIITQFSTRRLSDPCRTGMFWDVSEEYPQGIQVSMILLKRFLFQPTGC